MMQAHLKSLEHKHRRLDEMIRTETLHAAQDERVIRTMKAEKMHIKEEIARLKKQGETRH